jgi:hypothetical protein
MMLKQIICSVALGLLLAGCQSPDERLMEAIRYDEAPDVISAAKSGANVNMVLEPEKHEKFRVTRETTPLIQAIGMSRVNAVKALLQAGADPNLRDPLGMPPLLHAVRGNNLGPVRDLLEAKADPNSAYIPPPHIAASKTTEYGTPGMTALMAAIYAQKPRYVELLLKHGANIKLRDAQQHDVFWYLRGEGKRSLADVQRNPEGKAMLQMLQAAQRKST